MNKKIRNIFGILLFSMSISQILSQETRAISLNEAVKLGIENSKNLKIDAAKIEESTAQLLEAKNNQLPSLKLGATYLHLLAQMLILKQKVQVRRIV